MNVKNSHLQKNVESLQILYLNELGYGPTGEYTRGEWRDACLKNLLLGSKNFASWYHGELESIRANIPLVGHGQVATYSDGSSGVFFGLSKQHAWAVDFVGCVFANDLDLSDFDFLGSVLFVGAKIEGDADFADTRFHEPVHFDGVDFCGETYFNHAKFEGNASFNGTRFFAPPEFSGAEFNLHASFLRAYFFLGANFSDVTFKSEAQFQGAQFVGSTLFTRAVFCGQCLFGRDTFFRETVEKQTLFHTEANFENAVFKTVGHFEHVIFKYTVPSFLGTENATTRLEFSGTEYFPAEDSSERAIARLGHLKRLADEHGQTDQALNFNALELHAKAGLATTNAFTKLVTQVYGAVSDYGRSFTRPVAIYVALLLITLLLAAGHAAFSLPAKDCNGERWQVLNDLRRTTAPCAPATDDKLHLSGYRAAFEYTLYRAAGVLDFSDNDKSTDAVARRLFGQPIEPWWMRVWGVFKAVASTALLFLTALGLRNKYRIK